MATGGLRLTCSDGILLFYLFSLGRSTLDIFYHGNEFAQCQRPIHVWLLVSYVALVSLRVPHYVRQAASGTRQDANANELELGQATQATAASTWRGRSKAVLIVVWFALLPFFAVWTALGSFWLSEVLESTPECLPASTDPRFLIFWQVLCYLWIIIYTSCIGVAVVVRKRQQQRMHEAETNLRAVENEDTRSRWGSLGASWVLSPLLGLSAAEIGTLPTCDSSLCEDKECSICLTALNCDTSLRRLPTCGHVFHQGCIDLWLLRQNKCPLCKGDVLERPAKS